MHIFSMKQKYVELYYLLLFKFMFPFKQLKLNKLIFFINEFNIRREDHALGTQFVGPKLGK